MTASISRRDDRWTLVLASGAELVRDLDRARRSVARLADHGPALFVLDPEHERASGLLVESLGTRARSEAREPRMSRRPSVRADAGNCG